MADLKRYIQQQEVLVIAIGLVIGFALKDFVEKFLASFITPVLDRLFGGAGALEGKITEIGGVQFRPGLFVQATLDFFVIIAVVYGLAVTFNKARTPHSKTSSKK